MDGVQICMFTLYFLPWNRPLNLWISVLGYVVYFFRKQTAGDYQIIVSTEVLSPLLYFC